MSNCGVTKPLCQARGLFLAALHRRGHCPEIAAHPFMTQELSPDLSSKAPTGRADLPVGLTGKMWAVDFDRAPLPAGTLFKLSTPPEAISGPGKCSS